MENDDWKEMYKIVRERSSELRRTAVDIDKKIHNMIVVTLLILSLLTGLTLFPTTLNKNPYLLFSFGVGLSLIFLSLIVNIINYTILTPSVTHFTVDIEKLNKMDKIKFKEMIEEEGRSDKSYENKNNNQWFVMGLAIAILVVGLFLTILPSLYSLILV